MGCKRKVGKERHKEITLYVMIPEACQHSCGSDFRRKRDGTGLLMVSTRGPEEEVEAYIEVVLGAMKAESASGCQ